MRFVMILIFVFHMKFFPLSSHFPLPLSCVSQFVSFSKVSHVFPTSTCLRVVYLRCFFSRNVSLKILAFLFLEIPVSPSCVSGFLFLEIFLPAFSLEWTYSPFLEWSIPDAFFLEVSPGFSPYFPRDRVWFADVFLAFKTPIILFP